MDVFAFYQGEPEFSMLFHLTAYDFNITYKNIIEKFVERYYNSKDFSNYIKKIDLYLKNEDFFLEREKRIIRVEDYNKIVIKDENLKRSTVFIFTSKDDDIIDETLFSEEIKRTNIDRADLDEIDQKVYQGLYTESLALTNKNKPEYYFCKISLDFHLKDYEAALTDIKDGLRLYPDDKRYTILLANLYQKTNQHEKAIETYNLLIQNSQCLEDNKEYFVYKIAKSYFKMGKYSELKDLVKPYLYFDKCRYLSALTLVAENFVNEGLYCCFDIFNSSMDYKTFRKFIFMCLDLKNVTHAFIVELQNIINNTRYHIFFIYILYEYGLLEVSKSLLELLIHSGIIYTGKSSSIDLIYAKIYASCDVDFTVFKDFYINSLNKYEELFPNIVNIKKLKINELSVTQSPSAFSTISYGKNKSTYNTDQYDFLLISLVTINYMFCKGEIAFCKEICSRIIDYLKPYDPTISLVSEELYIFSTIYMIIPTIEYPLPTCKKIYVIGDYDILPLSYKMLTIMKEDFLLQPLLIEGIQIRHLDKSKNAKYKSNLHLSRFTRTVFKLSDGDILILYLGYTDVSVIKNVETDMHRPERIIEKLTSLYINAIKYVIQNKGVTIYVHPIVPQSYVTNTHFKLFNNILHDKLRLLQNDGKRVYFIDCIHQLLTNDKANVKQEYFLNERILKPDYVEELNIYFENLVIREIL